MKKYECGEQMSDFQELWMVVGERVGATIAYKENL